MQEENSLGLYSLAEIGPLEVVVGARALPVKQCSIEPKLLTKKIAAYAMIRKLLYEEGAKKVSEPVSMAILAKAMVELSLELGLGGREPSLIIQELGYDYEQVVEYPWYYRQRNEEGKGGFYGG